MTCVAGFEIISARFHRLAIAGQLKMCLLIALFFGFATIASSPASAEAVSTLVGERAEQELGGVMPVRGFFEVHVNGSGITDGEYIQEFWMDQTSGKFIANVVARTGETHRVWGAAILTVPVPVPLERKMPEEILKRSDLRIVNLPWGRLGSFAVDDPEELIGMQVRRMLVPGRPVPRQSVIPPIIISRGDKVKIKLTYGVLNLVAKGRAVSDAHLDQEIRVVNLSSNKTITAIARSEGIVEVLQ